MTLYAVLPWIAAAAFVLITLSAGLRKPSRSGGWLLPAVISAAFFGWSIFTIATEGLMGFWAEHTHTAWGNQVWFDLLIAVGVAWTILVPRLRAAGMAPLPWLALICCTGSIGLLAMLSRYLYLQDRRVAAAQVGA